MIKPKELEDRIMGYLRKKSGLNQHRHYLGMSQISKCPQVVVGELANGVDVSDFHHRMAYTGYMHELDVLQRLREMNVAVLDRREVVAEFDDRLRGHIDGLTAWGDLLEIKSVSTHKYELVVYHGRALHEHAEQVQLYMRYGGWQYTWIIYVNRETFEHRVVRVAYNPKQADLLEDKARRILAAIDGKGEPDCECGKCASVTDQQ
jgi:hypothetical protein